MVKNTEPEVVAKPKKNQLKKHFTSCCFLSRSPVPLMCYGKIRN